MRDILRRRFISDVFGTSKVNSGGASTHSSSATVGAPTNRNNDKLSRKPKQPNDQSGRILDRDGNRCIQKKDDTRPRGSFVQMWFVNTCRSEEHTSELQSLMRISYAVFCLKTKST